MIELLATPFVRRALVLLLLQLAVGYGFVAGKRYDAGRVQAAQQEYADLQQKVKTLGEQAQQRAAQQAAEDATRKDQADEQNRVTIAALRDQLSRMRDANARSRYVPAASPSASRPDLACFARADLESAIRAFADEVQGLVAEGDEARINLDTAKTWAQGH